MIVSMTGFGGAERTEDGVTYALEVRSLNHRYFKASIKLPESLQFLEGKVDRMLREPLVRGSVSFTLRLRNDSAAAGCDINKAALERYVQSITGASVPPKMQATIDLAAVAALPGVCQPPEMDEEARQRQAKIVEELTGQALGGLLEMRRVEGQLLRDDLLSHCTGLAEALDAIVEHAPKVMTEYQQRLHSRIETLLAEEKVELEKDALMREVAIYADRCDISEELARLRGHVEQFRIMCDSSEPAGRKLDFLAQEMLREANTIGSKGNDLAIARRIIEIKALIDRLKEQVQNVA
jgi:uncharacterized protein (TIGR00255 family)